MNGYETEIIMNRRKNITVFLYAAVAWILYRATMLIGLVPGIAKVPFYFEISAFLVFAVISYIYFKKLNYTTPLKTAAIFIGIVIVGDFILRALTNPSALRFYVSMSYLWFRFALLFVSIYLTGLLTTEPAKSKFPLRTILIVFCVILFFMAEISNAKGAHAETWILPIIMLVLGLVGAGIGAGIGAILAAIISLFKRPFSMDTTKSFAKYGAALGFMAILLFWYLGCVLHGTVVCLAQ